MGREGIIIKLYGLVPLLLEKIVITSSFGLHNEPNVYVNFTVKPLNSKLIGAEVCSDLPKNKCK